MLCVNFPVPKIEIIGDRDMYVKTGSTVAIRCVIKQSLEGPFYVFWYHEGDRILDYQLNKIDIQTKRIDQDTVSSLVIHKAKREDSGNYTCSPSSLDSASVQLHVLNGKRFHVPLKLNHFREHHIQTAQNEKVLFSYSVPRIIIHGKCCILHRGNFEYMYMLTMLISEN